MLFLWKDTRFWLFKWISREGTSKYICIYVYIVIFLCLAAFFPYFLEKERPFFGLCNQLGFW